MINDTEILFSWISHVFKKYFSSLFDFVGAMLFVIGKGWFIKLIDYLEIEREKIESKIYDGSKILKYPKFVRKRLFFLQYHKNKLINIGILIK